MVLLIMLFFVFSLYERKNEKQKKIKYHYGVPTRGSTQ
jgi:hypothetical protein